jgi:hypothetical protein
VSFREVGVHEVREVLRLWLRGEGFRAVARLARVDRKTMRQVYALLGLVRTLASRAAHSLSVGRPFTTRPALCPGGWAE